MYALQHRLDVANGFIPQAADLVHQSVNLPWYQSFYDWLHHKLLSDKVHQLVLRNRIASGVLYNTFKVRICVVPLREGQDSP